MREQLKAPPDRHRRGFARSSVAGCADAAQNRQTRPDQQQPPRTPELKARIAATIAAVRRDPLGPRVFDAALLRYFTAADFATIEAIDDAARAAVAERERIIAEVAYLARRERWLIGDGQAGNFIAGVFRQMGFKIRPGARL